MDINNIEQQLKRLAPRPSQQDAEVLWARIEPRLSLREAGQGMKSPYKRAGRARAIVSGFVILGLLGGSVVTAYASEALPGDALYSAKITLEKARIAMASSEKRKELHVAYAERRVEEIQKVLADVEEEPVMEAMPLAAGMPDPAQNGAPSLFMMAMEAPAPESATSDKAPQTEEGEGATAGAPESMAMMKAAPAVPPENPATTTAGRDAADLRMENSAPDEDSSGIESKKGARTAKKWKNLEKKKKAIDVAIKELERTKQDLDASGKAGSSARVDMLIQNLSALNTGEATPDEAFVERLKNGEVEIVPKEERSEAQEEGGGEDPPEGEVEGASTSAASFENAAALAGFGALSPEDGEELERIRIMNEERLKKISEAQKGAPDAREGEPAVRAEGSRVAVCLTRESGEMLELSILKRNIGRYIERGFVPGSCTFSDDPSGSATSSGTTTGAAKGALAPTTEDHADQEGHDGEGR